MLTFGEFKQIIAPYAGRAGKCADSATVAKFAREVMQSMLFSGSVGGEMRIDLCACRGRIILPPEVEVPIKIKIGSRQGNLWSKWLTFFSGGRNTFDGRGCFAAEDILEEEGTMSPLAYPLPSCGAQVGVLGTCEEKDDAYAIIQGEDTTGREVYTFFNGEKIVGEKFHIVKGEIRTGKILFGKITGVTKPPTNGYVSLFAIGPDGNPSRFLNDFNPSEERPLYRVWRLTSRDLCSANIHLSMLCRVRIKDSYSDNELTFFDNMLAIKLAAQRVQSETNNDMPTAQAKKASLDEVMQAEAGYKRTPKPQIDIFFPMSGGAVRNATARRLWGRYLWR